LTLDKTTKPDDKCPEGLLMMQLVSPQYGGSGTPAFLPFFIGMVLQPFKTVGLENAIMTASSKL
jgi:hypothetical protein